jgi:hypothetical protein
MEDNVFNLFSSAFTIIIVVVMIVQYVLMRRQIRLTLYAEYTKRYQEIAYRFPLDIFNSEFTYKKHKDQEEEILRNMRVYFDLCSEEYFLRRKLEKKVWAEWEKGMKVAFECPAFKIAWERFNTVNDDYFDEFKMYVNSVIYGV